MGDIDRVERSLPIAPTDPKLVHRALPSGQERRKQEEHRQEADVVDIHVAEAESLPVNQEPPETQADDEGHLDIAC